MTKAIAFALLGLLVPSIVWAQNAVTQGGSVLPRHVPMFLQDRQIGDAEGITGKVSGPFQGYGLAPFSVTDALGMGLCFNSGDTRSAFYSFCLGHDEDGNAFIDVDGVPARTLKCRINQGPKFDCFTGAAIEAVTSVGLSAPSIFSVTGSPVTSTGTLGLALVTQTANTVFSGPGSGAAAIPTFRALVSADLPAIACAGLSDEGAGCTANAANPTATAGPAAVNGSATTYMRSDAAPAVVLACGDLSNDGTACQASTGASGHTLPYLDVANAWSAAQRGAQGVVTPSGTAFTPDMNVSQHFSLTLIDGCPCTIANPSNAASAPGQVGMIEIIQTATGSETVTWGSVFKFAGAAPPVLAVGANAIDYLSYYVKDATHIIVAMGVTNAQ